MQGFLMLVGGITLSVVFFAIIEQIGINNHYKSHNPPKASASCKPPNPRPKPQASIINKKRDIRFNDRVDTHTKVSRHGVEVNRNNAKVICYKHDSQIKNLEEILTFMEENNNEITQKGVTIIKIL